jgi:hypothetical protein
MLQKVFTIKIEGKDDMSRLEEVVVGLLGGEHHRCSFLRSGEFVRLRNLALYHKFRSGDETALHSVHLEGLKITLTPTGTACVYITDACVVPVPPPPATASAIEQDDQDFTISSLVGKKRRAITPPHSGEEEDEEDADDCFDRLCGVHEGGARPAWFGGRPA